MLTKKILTIVVISMVSILSTACQSTTEQSTTEEVTTVATTEEVVVYNPPKPNEDNWELVFFDEFEGDTLDPTKWSIGYPWGSGRTHNYPAYIADENVLVENGLLRLKAENKRHSDAPRTITIDGKSVPLSYTSGAVNTQGKLNIDSGYVEAKIKIPNSKGFWPAFWMLGEGWPPEIDIMEILTEDRKTLHTNFHYGYAWNNKWSHYNTYDVEALRGISDLSDDFHTFAVEWNEIGRMRWFLDGKQIGYTYKNYQWITELQDMYILINLAVDGWAESPDETTVWPQYLEVDWVRVWQKGE